MTRAARNHRAIATGAPRLRPLEVAFLLLLGLGVLAGCGSIPVSDDGAIVDVDADTSIVQGAAAQATTSPDGRPYQYRAGCLEASKHPDAVSVLSKWVDDRATAWHLGNYHGGHKAKGHHWVIQRRVHS